MSSPPPKKKHTKIEDKIDPVVQGFLDDFSVTLEKEFQSKKLTGAAISIIIDSITYFKPIGVKSINSTDSINLKTKFRIAS